MAATPSSDEPVEALAEFLAIPSISMDPAHTGDMRRAAEWVASRLAFANGRVVETDGHPAVLGEWLGAPRAPTILVYGHYDVQPPGDAAGGGNPPFGPRGRDGRDYPRGGKDGTGPAGRRAETARGFPA